VNAWTIKTTTGDAGPFHQQDNPFPDEPTIWVHTVKRPALVLGSTQPEGLVDAQKAVDARTEVCRRRSGGGLVHLLPGRHLWVDVFLPRASPLWNDDVGVAFHWLGTVWADVLRNTVCAGDLDSPRPAVEVHTGPLQGRARGRVLCFAGLGPGEVTVDGSKVVGISQRRTRDFARFQCAVVWDWSPEQTLQLLDAESIKQTGVSLDDLRTTSIGLGRNPTEGEITEVANRFFSTIGHPW